MSLSRDMLLLPGWARNRNPRPEDGLGKRQGFMRTASGVMLEAPSMRQRSRARDTGSTIMGVSMAGSGPSPSLMLRQSRSGQLTLPSKQWYTHDGLVLQLGGQYVERVAEGNDWSGQAADRVRDVQVLYYLVDDTLEVIEQKQVNSGMPQGTLVKRHKVPNPAKGGAPFSWRDLVVGARVEMYGKLMSITDCNESTREFFASQGVECGADVERRRDAYVAGREAAVAAQTAPKGESAIKKYAEALLGNCVDNSWRQAFVDHGRTTLRFYALWRASPQEVTWGELAEVDRERVYTLNFFLASDKIEVLEQYSANDGRDRYPYLLKAQRVLHPVRGGAGGGCGKSVALPTPFGRDDDSIKDGAPDAYYRWQDLQIGAEVVVSGRTLTLFSADASTRCFYDEQGRPLGADRPMPAKKAVQYERPLPPPTGFGGDEDSLSSWYSLIPKAPKTAFELSRGKLDPAVLRFSAKLSDARHGDEARAFTLMVFMADGTVQVQEPPIRNSGIVGGKFMSRRKLAAGEAAVGDFYVGARVVVGGHTFSVTGADEKTLAYCAARPARFPLFDAARVARELAGRLWSSDKERVGAAMRDNLAPAAYVEELRALFPDALEQELLTVSRGLRPSEFAALCH
eukprot:g269.t1